MNTYSIQYAIYTLLLLLLQVIVLNGIHLFGYATPLLLIYAIIALPASTPRWLSLLTAFTIGLLSDIFSNTAGVAAAALTLCAFLQPWLLSLFANDDNLEELHPSMASMGAWKFICYSTILILINCAVVFTIEQFSFFHWQQLLIAIVSSSFLTFLVVLTIESIRIR